MKVLLLRFAKRLGSTGNLPWHFSFYKDMMKKDGHSVDIIDCQIENRPIEKLVEETIEGNYDIVGTGGIGTVYDHLKAYSHQLKAKAPEIVLVVGGQVLADHKFIMEAVPLDIAALGEGELTMVKIANCVEKQGDYADIPGIAFWKDGEIVETESEELIDLDELPEFNFDNLKMEKYNTKVPDHYLVDDRAKQLKADGHRYLDIFLARGCPYYCFFCYRQIRGWRTYSKERVEKLFIHMKKSKYTFLNFNDECLTVNKKFLKDLCELAQKHEIYWMTSGRVDHVNPETLKMLKDGLCVSMRYGIESFDDAMLKAMDKKTTAKQNIEGLNWSYQYAIHPGGVQFVMGAPGEDRETLFNSRKGMWVSYAPADRIAAAILNPYPGTPAYYYGLENGHITDKEFVHTELDGKTKIVVNFSKLSDLELSTWQAWLVCEALIGYRVKHRTFGGSSFSHVVSRYKKFLKCYIPLLFKEPENFVMFNAYLLKGFKYWLKPVKRLKWGELYNQDGSTHELPNSEIEIYDGNLAPRDSNEIPVSKDEDQEAPEVQGIYEVREEPKKLLQVESV